MLIDANGYRHNVGMIIIKHDELKLLWCKRVNQNAWQFPQGGIDSAEEPITKAMFRELYEEIGLTKDDVTIVGESKNWLRYKVPKNLIKFRDNNNNFIGQKQKWFLLRLNQEMQNFNFANSSKPEFDSWNWVNYWYPLRKIIAFKREVYRKILREFSGILIGENTHYIKRTRPLNYLLDNNLVDNYLTD